MKENDFILPATCIRGLNVYMRTEKGQKRLNAQSLPNYHSLFANAIYRLRKSQKQGVRDSGLVND